MKNKTLVALLSAVVITAGTIGGVAFANSTNDDILKENQQNIDSWWIYW